MSAQRLYWWGEDESEGFEFLPYREYFVRPHVRNDPIVKFKMILNTRDFMYAVSLRRSGKVDLYYNYAFVNESDGKIIPILWLIYRGIQRHSDHFQAYLWCQERCRNQHLTSPNDKQLGK
jgi:hypothetical protein